MPHAAGILLTHGNRALFLKRSEKARDHAGEWCCPGGSIEGGETPEQTARREMQEETGLTGLIQGNLNQIDEGDGFVTFRQTVDDESAPTLNDEHTEAVWAPLNDPPQPLHPGVAATLKKLLGGGAQDKREYDANNWFEVSNNPLSKVGVYQYSEGSIRKGGDRSKMVGVYRPAEELGSDDCINSFKLMPWTDDHPTDLLGDPAQGFVPTEEKGVHGVIGEKVYFKDGVLYGNLKIFSEALARKIAGGKKELSCGYHCDFVEDEGVYDGTPFQYVQRNMRGNHVASVKSGRMGSEVRVLDSVEKFTFALDLKETPMAREDEIKDCLDAETEKFIGDSFNSLVGELEKKGYSKGYATKVAGKVAAEKGNNGRDSIGNSTEITSMAKATDDKGDVKDPVKKDDKPKDDVSPGAGDEMEMDAKEAACDAEEEEKEKDDDTKEAKDRRRARDRRAGARDARKSARDAKAKDAEKEDDKDKKGMDASEVTVLVRKELVGKALDEAAVAAIVQREVTASASGIRKEMRKEEAAKSSLYGRLSPIVGAFDHAEMTHTEMAAYGLKKLGAQDASDPVMALDYLLVGRAAAVEPRVRSVAQDDAGESFVDKYIAA